MTAPAPNFTVEWQGTEDAKQNLRALAQRFPAAAAEAVREEAEVDMTAAKERTPVRTGNLRASGHVETDEEDPLVVHLKFGGPAAPYAVFVHENLNAHHPVGQAKFLESVVRESAATLIDRLAERIRSKVGASGS